MMHIQQNKLPTIAYFADQTTIVKRSFLLIAVKAFSFGFPRVAGLHLNDEPFQHILPIDKPLRIRSRVDRLCAYDLETSYN